MITYIYLESFSGIDFEEFIKQLSIYNEISSVFLVDASLNSQGTDFFISILERIELNNLNYVIIDEKKSFSDCLCDFLKENLSDERILFVTPSVQIDKESIEELQKVSQSSYHFAFSIPRCNYGHIQTVPISRMLFPDESSSPTDDSYTIFNSIRNYLPEYTMIPCTYDCCVMVNLPIVKMLNTFNYIKDDASSFEYLLREWSYLSNLFGYNTVMANKAFARNVINTVHTEEVERDRQKFQAKNADISRLLLESIEFEISPIDFFSDRICNSGNKKVLYFFSTLPTVHNGSSIHGLSFFDALYKQKPTNCELSFLSTQEAIDYWHLPEKYPDITFYTEGNLSGTFDVAILPSHFSSTSDCSLLNAHCLKEIVWPLDIISIRCAFFKKGDINYGFRFHALYSDAFIFFSEDAASDYSSYFSEIANVKKAPRIVTYITPPPLSDKEYAEDIPFEDFVLVLGNMFLHKNLLFTIDYMKKCSFNFIIVGMKDGDEGYISSNIYGYASGHLSDEHMSALYRKCQTLLFPSVYEGFGLPVVQTLNLGKDVVVMDHPINHELETLADDFKGHIQYMQNPEDMQSALQEAVSNNHFSEDSYKRTWDDCAKDCWPMIEQVVNAPLDIEKLTNRWLNTPNKR